MGSLMKGDRYMNKENLSLRWRGVEGASVPLDLHMRVVSFLYIYIGRKAFSVQVERQGRGWAVAHDL
jgi:hypothetical protein